MLSAYEYIKSKQIQWARNRGLSLIGSEGSRGRPAYTQELALNLFSPLEESSRKSFDYGNGNEIVSNSTKPGKMQAVHSSSALAVNVFQYWEQIRQVPVIASACGFCRMGNKISEKIIFEEKFPIKGIGGIPPNIDVVIHNSEKSVFKRFAIECKFSEAYRSSGQRGLKSAYFEKEDLWQDIPELHNYAITINPRDAINRHLDAAQLIKHILGLKSVYTKSNFKLLYLWYDVLGKEGADHQEEIDAFTEIAKSDGIHFSSLTYQELIIRLANEHRNENTDYVKYLTERYL
jgi:hypothetical protein